MIIRTLTLFVLLACHECVCTAQDEASPQKIDTDWLSYLLSEEICSTLDDTHLLEHLSRVEDYNNLHNYIFSKVSYKDALKIVGSDQISDRLKEELVSKIKKEYLHRKDDHETYRGIQLLKTTTGISKEEYLEILKREDFPYSIVGAISAYSDSDVRYKEVDIAIASLIDNEKYAVFYILPQGAMPQFATVASYKSYVSNEASKYIVKNNIEEYVNAPEVFKLINTDISVPQTLSYACVLFSIGYRKTDVIEILTKMLDEFNCDKETGQVLLFISCDIVDVIRHETELDSTYTLLSSIITDDKYEPELIADSIDSIKYHSKAADLLGTLKKMSFEHRNKGVRKAAWKACCLITKKMRKQQP